MRTLSKISPPKFSLAMLLALSVLGAEARAALLASGDINAAIDPLGYGIPGQPASLGGDLIIAQTDVAGLFINQQFEPGPLIITNNGIIGRDQGSIGAVDLTEFFSDWLIGGNLIVGQEGIGTIDVHDSAKVQVGNATFNFSSNPASDPPSTVITSGGLATIGQYNTGLGTVTLSGVAGSRLVVEDLIVGDYGVGNLIASSRASVYTQKGYIGNGDGSVGYVSISDLGTRWTVGENSTSNSMEGRLTIGNLVGQGEIGLADGEQQDGLAQGTLRIANQGLVQVSDEVIIGLNGHLLLETKGRLRVLPTSEATTDSDTDVTDAITNEGLISGDGYIDFAGVNDGPNSPDTVSTRPLTFLNGPSGEIRNSSNAYGQGEAGAIATNQREKLVFTGNVANGDTLTNNGTIESLGGEMEFNVPVTNNLEIIARDAVMRFNDGLLNNASGTVIVGGDSTLHGTISPAPLSNFVILNDSIVTITGDLIFTEPFLLTDGEEDSVAASGSNAATLSIGIGSNPGYLTVVGNLDLTNAVLDLDFAGTAAPVVGDIVNLIQVNGDVTGTFENSTVNVGGQVWEIDYSGGDIFATFTGIDSLPGDFNGDGLVDGRDFLAWQRNPSVGSLSDWQSSYGQGGSLTAAATSVPEPGTIVLLLAAALGMAARKR